MTAADHSSKPVEYHTPLRTVALSGGFFAVVAAVFAWMAIAGRGPFIIVAALCAAFFGYMLVRLLLRALLRHPFAVLSEDGMTLISGGHVMWDDIASVAIYSGVSAASWKAFLGIELQDPQAYLAQVGYNQRRVANAQMARGLPPIRLSSEAFPVPLDQVIATMKRFHPAMPVNA